MRMEPAKFFVAGCACVFGACTIWPLNSFRPHQLGDSLGKLCGRTRHASSLLWVSDRINSNHCGNAADLSENGCAGISKICEALVVE